MKTITYYKEHLDELGETFFPDIKIRGKHLTYFKEETPAGHIIEGYLNRKPNKYLGSMVILSVDDEPTNQFIQSMPKIHYYKDERDIPKTQLYISCYEKLDGTCLILYPLKNKDNEIIEIVPKTRGRAVADKHFQDLYYHKIDRKPIQNYYKKHDSILIFELYGILNQHDIIHYDTGAEIRLITIIDNGFFMTNNLMHIAKKYHFKIPDHVFSLYNINKEWYLKWTSEKYAAYKPMEFQEKDKYYPTITDAVDGIKHELEELNRKYNEINGRIATEGVVINAPNPDNTTRPIRWLKCKPRTIEQKHKTVNGIPRRSITKEVLKYFDEYGSEVKEIYNTNPNHHTEYLHRMLSEEYNTDIINKSKKKIEKIFLQIWESKTIPESLHNISEEIYTKYHKEGLHHCMRMFAEEYPMLKKDARTIYGILEKLFIKHKEEL